METVIDSRSKHEFSAKKGLERVGRSTFLLGADQRLSGEGVFNGIYYDIDIDIDIDIFLFGVVYNI